MSRIKFTVETIPVAQPRQRHRVIQKGGKAFATNYTPKSDPVTMFKSSVQLALCQCHKTAPLDKPVVLVVDFVLPRPKAMIWKGREMWRVPHAKRPDIDNLLKSLKDALTGLAWRDDSQVWEVEARKWIAGGDEKPHVRVEIYEREECR